MDSRLRGNDGEHFARMTETHDCVVIDLPLSFPRRRESIGHHSDTRWVLFLKQPNLPCLGPFFRRIHHRAIKQICHIEHFQVRSEQPVRNHIFAAILAFVYLQKMQMAREVMNIYQHQRELFKEPLIKS